jgi:hypothetical protein
MIGHCNERQLDIQVWQYVRNVLVVYTCSVRVASLFDTVYGIHTCSRCAAAAATWHFTGALHSPVTLTTLFATDVAAEINASSYCHR